MLSKVSLFLFFLLFMFTSQVALAATPRITIALLDDGPKLRENIDSALLKREIREILSTEFEVIFEERYHHAPNWQADEIRRMSEKALQDDNVDVIIATGILNAHYYGHHANLTKPVLAPFVIDPALQGIKLVDGKSGVKNFTYLTRSTRPSQILGDFSKISAFNKIAILGDSAILEAIPQLQDLLLQLERGTGIQARLVGASQTPEETLAKIEQDVDAVLLAPLPRFALNDIKKIADGLLARKLPGFTLNGQSEVEQGLLAGYDSDADEQRVARRIALNIQRILFGEKPESLTVIFNANNKIILNQATAYILNRFPGLQNINRYEVINRDAYTRENVMRLDLKRALLEVRQRNLGVIAAGYQNSASAERLKSFRARLLPGLDLTANTRRVNEASANTMNPENQSSAQLRLTQVLYSDEAIGVYRAQRYLFLSDEQVLEQVRQDAVLETAVTYLSLLQARKVEVLQKNNLDRAKRNLELANIRRKIGVASAGEVYRWESEIASSRSAYVSARAQANQLNVNLLQLLNYSQNRRLELESISLENSGLFFNDERFDLYVKSPWSFREFHQFMVEEAMFQAPELRQLQAELKAQERNLTTAKRKRWAPLVTASASRTNILNTDGVGSGPVSDEDSWRMGVDFSVPIFAGGANNALSAQEQETLQALQTQIKAVRSQIEQQVRKQLLAAEASFPIMQYSADAASAANKNLDLVEDAYKRGSLSILDLIDAQNAALTADIQAANSVYDFMIDYFTLERAVGRFDVLSDLKDKEAWYGRLESFFNTNGSNRVEKQ